MIDPEDLRQAKNLFLEIIAQLDTAEDMNIDFRNATIEVTKPWDKWRVYQPTGWKTLTLHWKQPQDKRSTTEDYSEVCGRIAEWRGQQKG